MKKFIGIVMVIVLINSMLLGYNNIFVHAAGTDIAIINYETSKDQIQKGDSFTLSITLKKYSDSDIKGVYLVVDNDHESSFALKGNNSYVYLTTIEDGTDVTYNGSIDMTYNGGSSINLPVRIVYIKDGKEEGVTNSIRIDNIYYEGQDTKEFVPRLSVADAAIPTVKAGDGISLDISIKNISKYAAKNITITPNVSAADEKYLFYDNLSPSQSVSLVLPGKSENVIFKFKTSKEALEKTYPIELKYEFSNTYGNTFTSTNTVYIKVINTNVDQGTSPKILIDDIQSSPWVVTGGESSSLKIDLENTGSLAANNIKVTLSGLKEEGFSILNGTNIKYLSKIDGNQKASISYSLASSKKMETGNYSLSVKIEYKDQSGDSYSDEQQFFIPVQNSGRVSSNKTVPKIILERYSAEPAIVRAGENFKLNLSFLNTSESKAVQNIKIFLTVNETSTEGGNIFTPVNSSNTFFIDYIEAKGSISKELTMFTIPDAKAKTYTITANFEYEDNEGNEYKATELIGIPVQQKTRLETSEISFPTEAYPGQPFPVAFDFYNMGKVTLSNLMIKMEGEFDTQNSSYFVGNFEPGSSDHYEGMVVPRGPGQAGGAVVVSYDDPTGQHVELRKDFAFKVVEMPAPPMEGQIPGKEQQPGKQSSFKKLIKSPFLWGGVVAILGVSGMLIRRRIVKRKGGMTLDE